MGEVEEEPRWFYVGNGQLRRKDSNGWTDDYQELDGPKKAAAADAGESAEVPEPVIGDTGPGWGSRALSSLGRLCSATAHRLAVGLKLLMVGIWHLIVWLGHLIVGLGHLIAKGYRMVVARAHAHPRRGRHRSSAPRDLQPEPYEADRPSEALSRSSSS